MDYGNGIFEWVFGLFSEKWVGYEKPTEEEEDIDREEGCNNEEEEPVLDLCLYIDGVDIVMESNRVLMTKNDPEHTEWLDTVEYIEDVVLVLEDLERLLQVEGV